MTQTSKMTAVEEKSSFSFLSLMQNIGKSLVFPIATLPAAALLLRIGVFIQSFGTIDGGFGDQLAYWVGFIMSTPGAAVFDNMPIIFGIGVAFGFAKENRGEVALVGAIAYFALIGLAQNEGSLSTLVYGNAKVGDSSFAISLAINDAAAYDAWLGGLSDIEAGTWSAVISASYDSLDSAKAAIAATGLTPAGVDLSATDVSLVNSGLLYLNIFGDDGSLLTSTWLMNFGVFGGILTGLTTALIYNKFSDVRLHQSLGFFSGRRFVPIVTLFIMIGVALGMAIVWPWINICLIYTSIGISKVPWLGAGLYGFVNRLLIPFGLHQVLNTYFWFQSPVVVAGSQVMYLSEPLTNAHWTPVLGDINAFADIQDGSIWMINGNVYQLAFGTLGSNATFTLGEVDLSTGVFTASTTDTANYISLLKDTKIGMYQAGFYPTMMFGLPAVAIAMAIRAEDEYKKQVWAFMIAGSVVAFLTGITEPLEFAFMFISPVIYLCYSALTGVFASIVVLFGISNGFGFSAGMIDWLISLMGGGIGVLSAHGNWANLELLLIGALAAVANFFMAYFLIGKLDIATPGRNGNVAGLSNGNEDEETTATTGGKADAKLTKMAEQTIDFIGLENIKKIDNCITRVRLTVKDNSVYDDADAVKIGYTGVIKVGKQAYQMIIGPQSEVIANEMRRLISEGYGAEKDEAQEKE